MSATERMRRLAPLISGLIVALPPAALAVPASASTAHVIRLSGDTVHAPRGARSDGALPASTTVDASIVLRPRDPARLAWYARSVTDPVSPLYRHYLTVAQFAAEFGAAPRTVAEVRAALAVAGLRTGGVSANGLSLTARAPAATIDHALSVSLVRFRLADGRRGYLNTAAPALPATVAPLVQSVVGLDTVHLRRPAGLHRLPRATDRPSPRLTANTAGPQGCPSAASVGVTANQIAAAYRYSGLYSAGDTGAGATIALYELEPFSAADIGAYQSCYGTSTSVTTVGVDGGAGSGAGAGEAALDIEDVIGLAPAAHVRVYEGPNSGSGPYDVLQQIVSDNTAKVISTSWGLCESELGSSDARAESVLFSEALLQGQSVLAASGDSGAEDCGGGYLPTRAPSTTLRASRTSPAPAARS